MYNQCKTVKSILLDSFDVEHLIKWSDPLFLTEIYLLEIFSYVDSDPYYGMPLETKKLPSFRLQHAFPTSFFGTLNSFQKFK